MKNKTDWTEYYKSKKSWFSTVTQRCTIEYLEKLLCDTNNTEWIVCECGGGNSCFVNGFRERLYIKVYDIIDNCELAVELARENRAITNAYCIDLLKESNEENLKQKYNLVYSVGLVEHFSDEERQKIIFHHFAMCEEGGYVLITAPTPTLKYRFIRKCMELMHVWQFWDETPLTVEQLRTDVEKFGEIVFCGINKKLPLTQAVILVRK